MRAKSRMNRAMLPFVGTATAAATVIGAGAPMSLAASAAPDAGDVAARPDTSSSLGAAAQGTFESCSAYFGFGKNAVAFEVVDSNGDDGVAHAVPDDVEVILVIETEATEEGESGDTIECTPEEVTEEQWNDEYGDEDDNLPAWPGPGHYAYPAVNLDEWIEGYGQIVSASFQVVSVADGHTLVSPTGVEGLDPNYLDVFQLLEEGLVDPRVQDLLASEVSTAAATAFESALVDCEESLENETDPPDLTGADFRAAVEFLADFADLGTPPDDLGCFDPSYVNTEASMVLSAQFAATYTETITLALPVEPTPAPTPTPAPAPAPAPGAAADAVTAPPSYTG